LDFIKQTSSKIKPPKRVKRPDTEALKKLQSLGYITTGTKVSPNSNLPDLKDKIQSINEFEQAKELYDNGFYNEALSRALNYNTSNPEVIPGLELVANCYYKKNMFEQALPYYRAVLKRDPGFVFAMYSILSCLTNVGKLEEGIKEGETFIKIYQDDYLLLNKLANLYFLRKDFDRAIEITKNSLQIEENNLDALKLIANIKIIRKETESARGFVDRILHIDSLSKDAYFYLAQIESIDGNIKKAIQYYKKELEINPENYRAAYNVAEELRTSGDMASAVLYYRQVIKIQPGFNVPYFIIAKYMIENNLNVREAVNLCKEGISIKPSNRYTLFGYSILVDFYKKSGDIKNANIYFSQGQILFEKLKKDEKLH
jgi:tetratricopeptide (TPR) repeat protein